MRLCMGMLPPGRAEGTDYKGGNLAAAARMQAPVKLLHHDEEARCHEHVQAAQSASATGLLDNPLWVKKALQMGHCLGVGCS